MRLTRWLRGWRQVLPDQRGRHVEIAPTARFVGAERIVLGDYVYIGPECTLEGKGGLCVGDGAVLAPRVTILTSTHDYQQEQLLPYHLRDEYRPVTIGRGAWIGWGAMLVPGVSVGDGAVVAMGAVVTQAVSPGQVVGGNPARELARRPLEVVERLVREEAYFLKRYWGQDRRRPGPHAPAGGSP